MPMAQTQSPRLSAPVVLRGCASTGLVPAVGRATGLTEYHKPPRVFSWAESPVALCIMSFDVSRERPLLFCSLNVVICFPTLLGIVETSLAMYYMWRHQLNHEKAKTQRGFLFTNRPCTKNCAIKKKKKKLKALATKIFGMYLLELCIAKAHR